MNEKGFRFKKVSETGAIILYGDSLIKPSSISSKASFKKIIERIGKYEEFENELNDKIDKNISYRNYEINELLLLIGNEKFEELKDILLNAQTWQELHTKLNASGCRFEKTSNTGGRILYGNIKIKPSLISNKASFNKLVKRLGEFEEYKYGENIVPSNHAENNEEHEIINKDIDSKESKNTNILYSSLLLDDTQLEEVKDILGLHGYVC